LNAATLGRRAVLRVEDPHPSTLGFAAILVGLLWPFIGFLVYWTRTGSTTVLPDTLTNAGGLVLLGPLVVVWAILLVGPRGPLVPFFRRWDDIELDQATIAWTQPGSERTAVPWSEVGGAETGGGGTMPHTEIVDMTGQSLARIDGWQFRDRASGRRGTLPAAIVAVRPDRYELEPRRRGHGYVACIVRLPPVSSPGGGGDSAPSAR
jgi:hypothetical protein